MITYQCKLSETTINIAWVALSSCHSSHITTGCMFSITNIIQQFYDSLELRVVTDVEGNLTLSLFCSLLFLLQNVGSRTQDRAKAGPGLVEKIADLTIFNQSKGKSGSYTHAARAGIEDLAIFNQSKGKSGYYDHAARVGMQNHSKGKSLLHLTSSAPPAAVFAELFL
jgi:hypothetical protein